MNEFFTYEAWQGVIISEIWPSISRYLELRTDNMGHFVLHVPWMMLEFGKTFTVNQALRCPLYFPKAGFK